MHLVVCSMYFHSFICLLIYIFFSPLLRCTVLLLQAHGADVTIRDNQGKTARDYAQQYGKHDIVALLDQAQVSALSVPLHMSAWLCTRV